MKKFGSLILLTILVSACGNSNNSNNQAPTPETQDSPAVVLAKFDETNSSAWQLSSRTSDVATNAQEFSLLAQKYPQYLSKFDPTTVTNAEIDISIYKFIGYNTCAENDLRLTFTSIYYSVCSGTQKNRTCEAPVMMIPPDSDPCSQP